MSQANTKPSAAIVYDVQTAKHAQESATLDFTLLADAKRMGGVANKEWRVSFMVGSMAGIAKKTLEWAAEVLTKANPDSKGKPKRTQAEQKIYDAARARLSRFCKVHSITPANKARGKPGKPAKDDGKAKDTTPKAINTKQADAYIRMQAAVLKAYAEKNHTIMPLALRSAIAEFAEAVDAVPVALSDEETK